MLSQLTTSIQLAIGRMRRPPPLLATRPDTEQMIAQAAAGMAYYLGQSDDSATLRAQAAYERRQRRCVVQPLSDGLVVSPEQAAKCLQRALKKGSCLLALPFSGAALELLHDLASTTILPLIVIESPALKQFHAELGAKVGDLPHCQTADVIKHVKVQVGQPQAVVYISFPELHLLTTGTTANATFLGKACRFSVLDSLLCRYGLKTLLTIGYFPSTASADPELVTFDTPLSGPEENTRAITTLMRWLLGHLQTSASVAPDDTLSWHHLYRASMHCYQIERHNRIEQLDAYVDAWRRSPAGMPDALYGIVTARLAALRDAK